MARHKEAEYRKAVEIILGEGVFSYADLAQRVKLSEGSLRKELGSSMPDYKRQYRQRCEEAKRLYVEQYVDDLAQIAVQSKLDPAHLELIFASESTAWQKLRAEHQREHPVIYQTMEVLHQAGTLLVKDIREKGYTDENAKKFVDAINALERLETGEFRVEMAVSGIQMYADWLRDHAKALKLTAHDVQLVARTIDEFRRDVVTKARGL